MEEAAERDAAEGMRRVVLYELMSLDGFADDPGEGEWLRDTGDGLSGFLAQTIATQDAVLLGRLTYEKWAPYWPTSTMQPFAGFINAAPKFVFTSQPLSLGWEHATQVAEPAVDFVRRLASRRGGDIGVHGSLTVARALLEGDLVDDLRLVIAPTLAGRGKRLFADDGALRRFELVSCERSGGCLLVHYRRRDRREQRTA